MPEEKSLYEDMVEAGVETDHHESDLYVLDTPTARAVLQRHGKLFAGDRREAGGPYVARFVSEADGRPWVEVPFSYDPFWKGRGWELLDPAPSSEDP